MSMEIPNINEEKGEQIKEGMYKKVVESTDHKESDLGYIKNKEDRKTIVNNYSIEGDGGDLYELSEKIDEIYSAQEVEKKEYTGRELYSEVSPIKKMVKKFYLTKWHGQWLKEKRLTQWIATG